jgi:hypothetical protein
MKLLMMKKRSKLIDGNPERTGRWLLIRRQPRSYSSMYFFGHLLTFQDRYHVMCHQPQKHQKKTQIVAFLSSIDLTNSEFADNNS